MNNFWKTCIVILSAAMPFAPARSADLRGIYSCWANELQDDQGRAVAIPYSGNDEKFLVDFKADTVQIVGHDTAPIPAHSIIRQSVGATQFNSNPDQISGELSPNGTVIIAAVGSSYTLTYQGYLTNEVRVTVRGCSRF